MSHPTHANGTVDEEIDSIKQFDRRQTWLHRPDEPRLGGGAMCPRIGALQHSWMLLPGADFHVRANRAALVFGVCHMLLCLKYMTGY